MSHLGVGTRIGPYEILRKIGVGGMGSVFEAVHEAIERRVAIKILHPESARSPEVATRFLNETIPNIPPTENRDWMTVGKVAGRPKVQGRAGCRGVVAASSKM